MADDQLNKLDELVSPYGVVRGTRQYRPEGWTAQLYGCHADGGSGRPGSGADLHTSDGGGRSFGDPARARLVAIAEAAERYSAYEPPTAEHRWATVFDLEGPVLDIGRLPRCSAIESADPACPIVPFDPGAPIRWVQGMELVSGKRTWLPAVMATYRLHPAVPAERFWYRLSTGFAVHHDPVEALVRAVLEVVERDAIALTWLQRMPLPPLPPDLPVSPAMEELLDASHRHFLRTLLFDATTDLGVPTVYCLQVSEHDRRVRHVVGCAADRTLSAAAEKALGEALGVRGVLYDEVPEPASFAEFTSITDGARYMASPLRADAFAFLHEAATGRPRAEQPGLPADPRAALAVLLDRFAASGMPVYAVDRSHCELRSVGLSSFNVVIPDLMPMTLTPVAQFRAHPRLFEAPAAMGFTVHSEEGLNPWPQPFA
ncbi:YcaO-like family protein [Streptomyces sp. NPDC002476]|uniref:YcaO-like family protein n=1 Tax=Streptomyces sp. NPDC002476 TaxID=3364648 RepID=UPI0036B8E90C